MTFWGKAWIRVEAILKAALGLVLFLAVDYVVLYALIFLNIDRSVYKGTSNFLVSIGVIIVMFIVNKLSSAKKEPLFKMAGLTADQVAALIIVALGMLGFVMLYIIVADRISVYLESLKEAVADYRESTNRFASVSQTVVPIWDKLLYVITLCFIVPVSEEMTFRGVIFGNLRKGFGPWVSVLLSALGFGIMHGLSVHIGYAIVCGIIIAACYYLTDSLIAPVILHMVFNIFGSGIANFMMIETFNVPDNIRSAISSGINTSSMIFMPVAVLAFAYLVNVKRKNAKQTEEEKGQKADDAETVNEINAESKTGNEAGNDMPAITEADGIEVQK